MDHVQINNNKPRVFRPMPTEYRAGNVESSAGFAEIELFKFDDLQSRQLARGRGLGEVSFIDGIEVAKVCIE